MNLTEHEKQLEEMGNSEKMFLILLALVNEKDRPNPNNACNSCPHASWSLDSNKLTNYCKSKYIETYNSLETPQRHMVACVDNPLHLIAVVKNK